MTAKNSEYWEKRIGYKVWKQYNDIEEKNRKLLAAYKKASDDIETEIFKWEQKLKTGDVLTNSEKYKLARQKELKAKIQKIVKQLGQDVKSFTEKNMKGGFTDTYKNIRLELGNNDFNLPNKKLMEELMKKPWKGSYFSERLWKNTFKLAQECNKILFNGLSQGKAIAEMAIALNNTMHNGFNNAHRLVRTETMHYLNSASLEAYRDAELSKVQFWAASDERTCDTCGTNGMHGKIYEIDKAPVLPLHPNCRCCYLPIVENGVKEKRGSGVGKQKKAAVSSIKGYMDKIKLQSLASYAKKKWQVKDVDIIGLDPKAVKETFNQLKRVFKDYPNLVGYVDTIFKDKAGIMATSVSNRLDSVNISFNPKYYKDAVFIDNQIKQNVKKGGSPKGFTYDFIGVHEFGHVIEAYLINGKYSDMHSRRAAWNECEIAKEIVKAAIIEAKKVSSMKTIAEFRKDISTYALYSYSETLADGFADYYANGNNAKILSKEIVKEINKWI